MIHPTALRSKLADELVRLIDEGTGPALASIEDLTSPAPLTYLVCYDSEGKPHALDPHR